MSPAGISLLRTKFIVGHRKSTIRSTTPSGANFSGRLDTSHRGWVRQGTLSLSTFGGRRAPFGAFTRTAGAHIFRERQRHSRSSPLVSRVVILTFPYDSRCF